MDAKNPAVVGVLAVAFVGLIVFRLLPALMGSGGGSTSPEDNNLVIERTAKPAVAVRAPQEMPPVYGTNPFREIAAPPVSNFAPSPTVPNPLPRATGIRPLNPGMGLGPLPGTGETEVVEVTPPRILVNGVVQNGSGTSLLVSVDGKDTVVPVGGYAAPELRLLEVQGKTAIFGWKGKRIKVSLSPAS